MKTSVITIILIISLSAPLCLWAASDLILPDYKPAQDADLEQVSEADLQEIEKLINLMETQSITGQAEPQGNNFQLDLVWKANTLVPYDYPGKALPSTYSRVTVNVIAHTPNPQRLTYNWVINDSSSGRDGPEQRGVGLNTFTFFSYEIPDFEHSLQVTAFDEATGWSASATLNLNTQNPEVYFYPSRNNSYYVTAGETTYTRAGGEFNLLVRPFYFNAISLNDLDFKWRLDNKPTENNNSRPEILPVNISNNTQPGSLARLKLDIENKKIRKNVYERATARMDLSIIK